MLVKEVTGSNSRKLIFKRMLQIKFTNIYCAIALRWKSTFDIKSTSIRVMTCCCQTTSHYLSQYWRMFMLLYGVTRPQWAECRCIASICLTCWDDSCYCFEIEILNLLSPVGALTSSLAVVNIEGILPKGPYPPCLRMADRALLAGYPRHSDVMN